MFVDEVLKRDFGSSLGYDEDSTLSVVIETLSKLSQSPQLVIKKHPQNDNEYYGVEDLDRARRLMSVKVFGREASPRDIALISDLVVGMSSVLLIESILLKKVTMSLQLNATSLAKEQCFPVKIGALPLVSERLDAQKLIPALLQDKNKRKSWLKKQSLLSHNPGAAKRVFNVIGEFSKGKLLN